MANDFGRYPGLPPRIDPGVGPVRPSNGGEVRPAGNVVVPVPRLNPMACAVLLSPRHRATTDGDVRSSNAARGRTSRANSGKHARGNNHPMGRSLWLCLSEFGMGRAMDILPDHLTALRVASSPQ